MPGIPIQNILGLIPQIRGQCLAVHGIKRLAERGAHPQRGTFHTAQRLPWSAARVKDSEGVVCV